MSSWRLDVRSLRGALLLVTSMVPVLVLGSGVTAQWPTSGGDVHNTRSAVSEWRLGPDTAPSLRLKWAYLANGNVLTTPAVDGGAVYFPDTTGWLHKVDATTGLRIWSRAVSNYTGRVGSFSRATPALQDQRLFLGTQDGLMLAIDKLTGSLLWKTQVDPHPAAAITQAPIVFNNRLYVGVSSSEETLASIPGYTCCSFRGSIVALDADTGAILWRTYTVPEGYSGGAVWGSTLAIDEKRQALYATTGNHYSVPAAVDACLQGAADDAAANLCLAPDDFIDSVLALDLATGAIKWGHRLRSQDKWTVVCTAAPVTCSSTASPDFDFGQGAILYSVPAAEGGQRDLVGAGQKSGIYWALDPDTGAVVWSTPVGPGSMGGGLMWGSAMAQGRIYTALANRFAAPYTLQPSGQLSAWGNFTALDAATGAILWQVPDPIASSADSAPVTIANGVVLGCSMDPLGHMYALDARDGRILWSFTGGGSCDSGAAVVNGSVYWGSGSARYGVGTPSNLVYAFTVP